MHSLDLKILDPRLGDTIPLPAYATAGSAAMDLRAVFDTDTYTLDAGASALIGTGLAIHIADPGYCAQDWGINTASSSATSSASSTATTRAS